MRGLRLLVLLRRSVIALESLASSQAAIAGKQAPPKRIPKMAEVFVPSVEGRNTEWQRRRDEAIYGEGIAYDDRN